MGEYLGVRGKPWVGVFSHVTRVVVDKSNMSMIDKVLILGVERDCDAATASQV